MESERLIELHLTKRVKARGGKCYKFSSPANRGVTDRIAFLDGQIWFIELKAPTGRLSALQVLFGEFLSAYTENYAVLKSKEDVDRWLANVIR